MKENKEGANLFIYFCIYPRGWKIYSNVAPPISFPYRNHHVGISYFENRTTVVVTIDRTILHGRLSKLLERRHCSKSTVGGIVRTVKW